MGKAASQSWCDLMKVGGPLVSEHELAGEERGWNRETGKEGTMWQEPWAQTEKILSILSFWFAAYWL